MRPLTAGGKVSPASHMEFWTLPRRPAILVNAKQRKILLGNVLPLVPSTGDFKHIRPDLFGLR
jgi:hypothetical protein